MAKTTKPRTNLKRTKTPAYKDNGAKEKNTLLALICEGTSLRKICERKDMPSIATVMRWKTEDPAFATLYVQAMQERTAVYAENMIEAAEQVKEGTLDAKAGQVYINTLMWNVSRLNRGLYGDKQDINVNSSVSYIEALREVEDRVNSSGVNSDRETAVHNVVSLAARKN